MYSIQIAENEFASSVSVMVNDVAQNQAEEGDQIIVSAAEIEGYTFEKWTVVGSDGTETNDLPGGKDPSSPELIFAMPAYDLTLKAYYTAAKPAETKSGSWVKTNGVWTYVNPDGSLMTGWLNDKGIWYYFNGEGTMVTGWRKIGNVYYFFDENGAMLTGWLSQKGTWYYLASDGAMAVGWQTIKNKKYTSMFPVPCIPGGLRIRENGTGLIKAGLLLPTGIQSAERSIALIPKVPCIQDGPMTEQTGTG
jgi:hypothetical protein